MKTALICVLLPAHFVLFMPCSGSAQTSNQSPQVVTYGRATNGISAVTEVYSDQALGHLPEIGVFVTNANADEIYGKQDEGTNLIAFLKKLSDNDWLYFMATNSFCGPIELRDAEGVDLTSLKPEVSSLDAYPLSYKQGTEKLNYLQRFKIYSGPGIFPIPLMETTSRSQVVRFRLGDYFTIKTPGEYKLTVWPKIYKRVATNNDTCQRIDLPPTTAIIDLKSAPRDNP